MNLDYILDMTDDCYPTISGGQEHSRNTNSPIITIKDEPMSECDSPPSSCPPSPTPSIAATIHRNRADKRVSIIFLLFFIFSWHWVYVDSCCI